MSQHQERHWRILIEHFIRLEENILYSENVACSFLLSWQFPVKVLLETLRDAWQQFLGFKINVSIFLTQENLKIMTHLRTTHRQNEAMMFKWMMTARFLQATFLELQRVYHKRMLLVHSSQILTVIISLLPNHQEIWSKWNAKQREIQNRQSNGQKMEKKSNERWANIKNQNGE